MVTPFEALVAFVIVQRLIELVIAKRNARRIIGLGGYEAGAEHYPLLLLLHTGFFVSLITETLWRGNAGLTPHLLPLGLFLLMQGMRIWCLASLGPFWNTRILILPGSSPVVRGPYRFLRHPNYVVVAVELLTLPLAFGAWTTAILFSMLNALVLRVRIRVEEEALAEATGYAEEMGLRARFLPLRRR